MIKLIQCVQYINFIAPNWCPSDVEEQHKDKDWKTCLDWNAKNQSLESFMNCFQKPTGPDYSWSKSLGTGGYTLESKIYITTKVKIFHPI